MGHRFTRHPNGKQLLFVGGPVDCVPALGRAWALGYDVLVVDGDSNAPGIKWASKMQKRFDDESVGRYLVSTYDSNAILDSIAGFKIDGCLAIACDVAPVVSNIAEVLGLPHVPREVSILSWDKPALKKKLAAAGVPVPGSADFIVKPAHRGRGARGVSLVSASSDDFLAGHPSVKEAEGYGDVLWESFVIGPQVSTESIVCEGRAWTYLSDRDYSAGFPVERGGWMPSRWEGTPKGREIKQTIQRVVDSLGIEDGTIKGDVVLDAERDLTPTVLECAIGRMGGGFNASHHIWFGYGVDFVGAACALAVGDDPRPYLIQKRKPKFTRGIYEWSGQLASHKERGRFFLAVGKTRREAELKADNWLKNRNKVTKRD